ncbi:MAG: hypothetical protein QMD94_05345 [Candidatus Omnitrophota bacterium]|nr:hypothetical protein [Candidatus Omnitrophota bacterium]
MIKINLLQEKVTHRAGGMRLDLDLGVKYLSYIVFIAAGFIVLAHIYLAVLAGFRVSEIKALNKKWEGLSSQRKELEDFNKEYVPMSLDAKLLNEALKQTVDWAEKLNKLSLYLPYGIWFREITISSKSLVINGSVVSLQKEEITLIRKFTDALKNDAGFFKDFVNLELGTVQARPIAGYDVFDFVLTGTTKQN